MSAPPSSPQLPGPCCRWRCCIKDEKAYQRLHFSLRHLTWMTFQTLLVPPPGKGHGAHVKGASYLKPCHFVWLSHSVTLATSESENHISLPSTTTTARLGVLSLRVIFPLTYFCLSLIALYQESSHFCP